MSNVTKNTVVIDKDKFKKAVKERRWTCVELSRHLGKSDSYVSTRVHIGTIEPKHMKRIEELLKAQPAEFVKDCERERKQVADVDVLLQMIAELEYRVTRLEREKGSLTFYEKLYGGKQA